MVKKLQKHPLRHLILILALPLLLSLLLLSTSSCNNTTNRNLDDADKLMISNPDSALSLLMSMDTARLSKAQHARHAVLKAKAQTKNYTPIDDESSLNFAVDYYQNGGDSLEVQSLYYHGRALQDMGERAEAMARFTMAFDLASLHEDHFYAAMAAGSLHSIYHTLYMVNEELRFPLATGTIGGLTFSLIAITLYLPLLILKRERPR